MNIFEISTRRKFRFNSKIGPLAVEDLWDLPLSSRNESLDSIAKGLNRQIKDSEEESFVAPVDTSSALEELKMRLEIVKHIISVKLAEKETARLATERKNTREKIMSIIESKKNEAMQSMDIKDLEKLLAELN